MNRCDICGINVHPQHEVCPLCGKLLGNLSAGRTAYPPYKPETGSGGFTVSKLLLFLVISVSVISIFINILTSGQNSVPWSVMVSLSLIFPWFIFSLIKSKKMNTGTKILYSYIIASVYIIAVDIFGGFNKWSTTFVIPFLTVAIAVVFTSIAISTTENFESYLGYLTVIFFISFCPVIIFLFSLSTLVWTSLVAALYCLLTVIGLIIFKGDEFKHEIGKRFHI